MKKGIWSGMVFWLVAATSTAATFDEGRHYLVSPFPQPVETGDKIEVREFFWYGCIHCLKLEPELSRWLQKKPKNVEFIRTPGTSPNWIAHAQAFYAFETLGVTNKLHGAFFDALHNSGGKLRDEASITQWVSERGVDPAKFRDAFNSFGVQLKVQKAKRLNEAFAVNSVPMLIVDGKYATSPSMAGGDAAIIEVVNFLVHKSAQERQKQKAK